MGSEDRQETFGILNHSRAAQSREPGFRGKRHFEERDPGLPRGVAFLPAVLREVLWSILSIRLRVLRGRKRPLPIVQRPPSDGPGSDMHPRPQPNATQHEPDRVKGSSISDRTAADYVSIELPSTCWRSLYDHASTREQNVRFVFPAVQHRPTMAAKGCQRPHSARSVVFGRGLRTRTAANYWAPLRDLLHGKYGALTQRLRVVVNSWGFVVNKAATPPPLATPPG